jgi:hypothetical protein
MTVAVAIGLVGVSVVPLLTDASSEARKG